MIRRLTALSQAGLLILSLAALLLTACRDDSVELLLAAQAPPVADTTVSFADDLLPLVEAYCATTGCHDGTTVLASRFSSYADIRPEAEAIREEVQTGRMPVGTTLPPAAAAVFIRWVHQGALNN